VLGLYIFVDDILRLYSFHYPEIGLSSGRSGRSSLM